MSNHAIETELYSNLLGLSKPLSKITGNCKILSVNGGQLPLQKQPFFSAPHRIKFSHT